MGKVLTDRQNYIDIANAIRNKGVEGRFKPSEMASAIDSMPIGGKEPNIISLDVTSNGTYEARDDVDGYSPITVNVPVGITPTGHIDITNTDIVDVTQYATAKVRDDNLKAENIFIQSHTKNLVATLDKFSSSIWIRRNTNDACK